MKLLVHKINLGDVEDPEIYAAGPIIDWEKTEKGQWLHEHSYQQMMFDITPGSYSNYGYTVNIHAWLEPKNLTYYKLKWGE